MDIINRYLELFETRLKTIDKVLKQLEISIDDVQVEKSNDSWDAKGKENRKREGEGEGKREREREKPKQN